MVQQRKFINELLVSYDMLDSTPKSTYVPLNLKLLPVMSDPLPDATVYRQLVGKLNFLLQTRPDLAFTIQYLSQFNKILCQEHYQVALHVLQYLKGTIDQALYFNNTHSYQIEAYCDSDWAAYHATQRSISGYFFMFGGSPISWKSKKQVTISLSLDEAEYRSMRRVTSKLAWISTLYEEL
ncbi:secreted RxLR effector protein 161-like [Lactuca sativa]|uniref:secreted RxLR effector protein 161-like n=1 Tax=Lactuca sativa TaxID=4236 RepID=UPI000CD89152|nr:secreted RxLR effector protein 161-like [Lactuca sativa]